jgi:hypothetical protein
MSVQFEFRGHVLGGMPVDVTAYIAPPDREVGIFNRYVEDFDIRVKGKIAPWITRKLKPKDWERLEEDALDAYSEAKSW